MSMSRTLARRIDRLAVRAHAFHRYAHHPLCERYRGELLALRGRTRVCRGCAYALLGALSGGAAGLLLTHAAYLPLMAAGGCALVALTLTRARAAVESPPARAHVAPGSAHARRTGKLWTRALPAFALTCTLVALMRAANPLALLPLIAAISCWRLYRRAGPDRSPCRSCPEQTLPACSGYLPIIRAERAFVRHSQRLIDAESRGA
jgi:hypothetical protein